MIKNTDLAYIAGYIDGDGCFYIGKTTNKKTGRIRYQAMLTISSTNKNILESFKSKFGGSVRLSDNRSKYPGQKSQYQYIVKSKKAFSLANYVENFLVEKRNECINFLKFMTFTDHDSRETYIEMSKRLKWLYYTIEKPIKGIILRDKNIRIPTELEYVYLAGFIDAECCFGISHYKPKNKPNSVFKIYLSCNNTKQPIFEWLVQRFGGSLQFIDRERLNSKHRNQFQWRLTGNALNKILPLILPYLVYKKPVCEKLIEFHKLTLPNGGDRQSAAFKQSYADLIKSKIEIVNQVHILNQKGISHLSG